MDDIVNLFLSAANCPKRLTDEKFGFGIEVLACLKLNIPRYFILDANSRATLRQTVEIN